MPSVLIVYYSHGGNTRQMAEKVSAAVQQAGCSVVLKKAAEATMADVEAADGLILGSPCYFGNVAAEMKQFIDMTIKGFGKGVLEGKPGAAFVSTGGIGGCGELALNSLALAMLIHGMLFMGCRKGGHLGPLAIGEPDQRAAAECASLGSRFADLVKRLAT